MIKSASPSNRPSKIRKVLLMQPPEVSPLSEYVLPTRYPLSLFTLAGAVIQRHPDIEIAVADFALPNMNLGRMISDFQPDLVGISFMTPQYRMTQDFVQWIRTISRGTTIVGGGVHASALPQETLEKIGFDYLVTHEGEQAFPDLIGALEKNSDPSEVASIVFRSGKDIIQTPGRPRIRDLDAFPLATDVLPVGYLDQYAKVQGAEGYGQIATLFTSRGCLRDCAFCGSNIVFNKEEGLRKPVLRSADRVLEEIGVLHDMHGIRNIRFADDYFDVDRNRAKYIAEQIIARGMSLKMGYMAIAKQNQDGDDDFYRTMYRAGVRVVSFGVESGDLRLMRSLGKVSGTLYAGQNTKAVQRAGLLSKYFLMVGFPGQDNVSIDKTLSLLDKDRPDFIGVAIAMPYPKTRLASMPGIHINGGFEAMIHEPPLALKGQSFIPFTCTDAMTSEEIGMARDRILAHFAEIKKTQQK